jgi:beta-glucanase (GH16 family)
MLKSSQISISFAKHLLAIIFLAVFVSCEKEEEIGFSASFVFEFIDDNNVKFINTSEGEYYSVEWNFGNGETVETTDRTKTYTVNYPQAGDYTVSLTVLDFTGNVKTDEQTITITANGPNYIPNNENLIWSDEFNGAGINSSNWTFETGANGWGNNELQNYTNGDNVELKDGKLVITAKKVNNDQTVGSYTSTRMITKDKQEFKYGKIEIRAKLPSGRGIWPAIWMLGANFETAGWPACGEIDIMEYVGYQPNTIHSTVHTPAGFGGEGDGSSKTLETAEEEFHIYGLIWNENELIFYTDEPENVTHTYAPTNKNDENWPFNKPQFFIFNIAVGGNWGGVEGIDDSIFPQTMEIDYVRVYQLDN